MPKLVPRTVQRRIRVQHVEQLELTLDARPAEGEDLGAANVQLVQSVEVLRLLRAERNRQRRFGELRHHQRVRRAGARAVGGIPRGRREQPVGARTILDRRCR